MIVRCPGKGCGSEINLPDHRHGHSLQWCPRCERQTLHFPQNLLMKRDGPRYLYRNPKHYGAYK